MIKKIIIGVVILAVIVLSGWKLFFSKDDVSKKLKNISEELTSYHMEGNMDLKNNEETRSYFITTDYLKNGEDDFFRVSMLDKNINQEQIMLRNKEGVFVLTPLLNQVYKFKGDWPLNNPKPYLYHSLLQIFDVDHEVAKTDDGYIVSAKSLYPNSPEWMKQEVKFTKELKPLWVNIFTANNEIAGKVVFTEVDMNSKYADGFFDVKTNIDNARKNAAAPDTSLTIDDLPLLPTSAKLDASLKEQTLATVNGKSVYIMTYTGNKSFTVVQGIASNNKELVVTTVDGDLIETISGWAIRSGNYLSYVYNGVSYDFYSKVLTVDELITIANGMEVVSDK